MSQKYFRLTTYDKTSDVPTEPTVVYVTDEDLEEDVRYVTCDEINEISKEEYDEGIERHKRKMLRFATGYPKA